MLIDWFTVGAQALNFIVLVWLMKRFLYKPILNAIEARESRIAKELADANAKRSEATKERDQFEKKNADLDRQRTELLSRATEDANTERQRLLDQARQVADALTTQRQEALKSEARDLTQAIALQTQHEVFSIARKTLDDLANTSLEERVTETFVREVHALGGQAKQLLGDALKSGSSPARVRSAFDLPADQQATIQRALSEAFSSEILLRFETVPHLICGIELAAGGQKISWSIAGYLTSMEQGLSGLLGSQDKAP